VLVDDDALVRAGVRTSTPPAEIVQAVRVVATGEAILSPSATRTLLDYVGDAVVDERRRVAEEMLARLTERERVVAVAVATGSSNAEIGAELYLSDATVKAHVSRLLIKLEAANRLHVAMVVHDAGQA
jgi:DNA-binding NarL/FixJ family response regulator